MNKSKVITLVTVMLLGWSAIVTAKAPLEGEPDWEARKRAGDKGEIKPTEEQRLLAELAKREQAEKELQKELQDN
ncbi:hypothetical protein L2719_02375 [Shewanella schlegeliana]|uniref:Uncharacterized protein n=1 Tax=Shewanella schlegeliana TaxID=190308 RepID=A0ABS1SYC6_9GAMM|nr:hypothetical protein [Shewanella schlegeliana]MBL4913523.1 hypothetical protein [Shewanella schlegeliana]MCL1108413.1 hypothetical protein [Shewanella schlegeliana]GIU28782.1 hypothetical protein TUM4433_17330 [Shewanella schlegeliana]